MLIPNDHPASIIREKSQSDEKGSTDEKCSPNEKDSPNKKPSSPDVESGYRPPSRDPFEVSFSAADPAYPLNMGVARKWLLVLIASSTSTCVACTSSLYTATYAQLIAEFGCSEIVATLGLSLFVMGLGLGPMLLAPLSEVSSLPTF